MVKYDIKCDICKRKLGETTNVIESYMGGTCSECKNKFRKHNIL